MSQVTTASAPKKWTTVSGKRMTLVVLITMLVTGGLFYWVTTAYGTYNASRRQTDIAWRSLATVLDARYKQYDEAVTSAASTGSIEGLTSERWQVARDAFSRTTLSSHQIAAARDLEKIVEMLPAELRDAASDNADSLKSSADNYAKAVAIQRSVGHKTGSQLLKQMLVLPDPAEFQLAQ